MWILGLKGLNESLLIPFWHSFLNITGSHHHLFARLTELLLNFNKLVTSYMSKPLANGRNIVGQQLPILLDVTCCVRFHTLLHVVASCWELHFVAQSLKSVKLKVQLTTQFFFR